MGTDALVTIFDGNGLDVIYNGDLANLGQALIPGVYGGEIIGLDVPITVDVRDDEILITFAR